MRLDDSIRGTPGRSAIVLVLLGLGSIAPGSIPARAAEPMAPRLPRDNLLVYRGEGQEPRPVKTIGDWARRRAEILEGMQAVMGRLPGAEKRCPLEMKVEEEVDCGRY